MGLSSFVCHQAMRIISCHTTDKCIIMYFDVELRLGLNGITSTWK